MEKFSLDNKWRVIYWIQSKLKLKFYVVLMETKPKKTTENSSGRIIDHSNPLHLLITVFFSNPEVTKHSSITANHNLKSINQRFKFYIYGWSQFAQYPKDTFFSFFLLKTA